MHKLLKSKVKFIEVDETELTLHLLLEARASDGANFYFTYLVWS